MEFTQEVQKATDPIYQKISKVMPEINGLYMLHTFTKLMNLKRKRMQ